MDINIVYALLGGLVVFWAAEQIRNPSKVKYASDEILKMERIEKIERHITTRSIIHQLVYPIYRMVERIKPTSEYQYEYLEKVLEESGEYDTRPEDIQVIQIFNALLYPVIFLILASLSDPEYRVYFIVFGIMAGIYMYNQPIRLLKAKKKRHDQQILEDMTQFTTVYMMLSSGNKTVYDALLQSIEKAKDNAPALGKYLKDLENNLYTRSTEEALRRFSAQLSRYSYIERFVNNVILTLQQGSNNRELNMRLRESLNDMDDEMINQKIEQKKMEARIPTYIGVLLMMVYMIIMIFVSVFLMLGAR